ncbi:hypothetical protein MKX01_012779 [Papaver californicum]|nr:hypothetical protein MKX01_017049 [Papaver californicum]KAI3992827.1 hypothetical protein MKX01_012779 [Papaver californicum]
MHQSMTVMHSIVLTGANGAGKSTFLRMLACFSRPSAGEILWSRHYKVGFFKQYKFQLNWLSLRDAVKEKFTVLDNVQWFEVLEGKSGLSMRNQGYLISMGQRKRLQLARVVALDRPIWLLDEPYVSGIGYRRCEIANVF